MHSLMIPKVHVISAGKEITLPEKGQSILQGPPLLSFHCRNKILMNCSEKAPSS